MIMIMISYNVLQKRLISQKYKKCSLGKYALLLYVAVSIRWISIRFDFQKIFLSEFCVAVKNLKMCKEKARKQRVDEEII